MEKGRECGVVKETIRKVDEVRREELCKGEEDKAGEDGAYRQYIIQYIMVVG